MTTDLPDAEIDELLEYFEAGEPGSPYGNTCNALRELKSLRETVKAYQHPPSLAVMEENKALRERHTGIEFLFTWIRAPNPMFGGVSPEQMILMGQGHKVIIFIHEAQEDYEAGLPSSSPDAQSPLSTTAVASSGLKSTAAEKGRRSQP